MKRYAKIAKTLTALILCMGFLVGCGKSTEEIKTEFSKILSNKATPQPWKMQRILWKNMRRN